MAPVQQLFTYPDGHFLWCNLIDLISRERLHDKIGCGRDLKGKDCLVVGSQGGKGSLHEIVGSGHGTSPDAGTQGCCAKGTVLSSKRCNLGLSFVLGRQDLHAHGWASERGRPASTEVQPMLG